MTPSFLSTIQAQIAFNIHFYIWKWSKLSSLLIPSSHATKLFLICETHTLTKFKKVQYWFRKVNKYTKPLNEAWKKFSPELSIFSPLALF